MAITANRSKSAGLVAAMLQGLVLLSLAQGPAVAAGKVDPGFAENGLFRSDFSRTLALDLPDGTLVVRSSRDDDCCAGFTTVTRLDRAGRAEPLAGLSAGYTTEVAALRPAGGWLLGGSEDPKIPSQRGFIAAFTASGQPDYPFEGAHVLPRGTVSRLVVQPDGRILVAENAPREDGTPCSGAGWTLRRLTATGRNDDSWGRGGTTNSQLVEGAAGLSCRVHHLWLQPDGRVMLGTDAGFLRLLQDGQPDPTFAWANGVAEVSDPVASSQVMPLASGGFVLANTAIGRGGGDYTVLSRIDGNGRLDRAFGDGDGLARIGVWQQVISDEAAIERVNGTFLVPDDGKHLYAAVVLQDRANPRFDGVGQAIARFTRGGRLDTGFGTGGVVVLSLSSGLDVKGLLPQPDGGLLVVTAVGVFRLTGDDRPSPGLVEAYFASNQVEEGGTANLVVNRLAGADGPISVTVRTDDSPMSQYSWNARPGEHYVPVSRRLDWADADRTSRFVAVTTLDDGVAQPNGKVLGMQVGDAVGSPLVLWSLARIDIRDKTTGAPRPPAPPPPATPPPTSPPTGAPGAGDGGSGGGGALGSGTVLWLLLLAAMAAPQSAKRRLRHNRFAGRQLCLALTGAMALATGCLGTVSAWAAGKLDSSYGAQGMYRTVDRYVPLVLPHPDGRSVFVVSTQADNCCSNSDASVRLLDAQGRPRPDYGDGGVVQFQLYLARAGVVLPDGGVILGGQSDEGGGFLASLSPTGAPGRFFAGKPVFATGNVTAVARDREGGILFAESGYGADDGLTAGGCAKDGWRIRRLNAAGEVDSGWGERGAVTSLTVEGSRSFTCDVGRLWVTPAGDPMVATVGRKIFRLRADGQADPGFTPIAVPGSNSQFQVMSLADGRLLVAAAAPLAEHTTISRYDDRGLLDRSFGSGAGEVTVDLALAATGSSSAREAPTDTFVVGDDGRHIYLAVWAYGSPTDPPAEPDRLGEVVARLTQDGRLDPAFGDSGVVRLTRAAPAGVHGLFPHPDGSLLIGTQEGVLKLAGGDESSPGLVDAYFSNSVQAGQRLQLVVSRLAGSDGLVTVRLDPESFTVQSSVPVVPFSQTLTWAHGEAGDKTVEIQTLAGGPAEGILTVRLVATGGKPLILRDPLYAYVKGSTSSTPPPPTPPPATTPPPTGAPGAGNGGSGGGGALGSGIVLWLLLLASGVARKVQPAGGNRP